MEKRILTNKDFTGLVDFMEQNYNLQTLEEITKIYLSSNMELSITKHINFQMQLFNEFGEMAQLILDFLESNESLEYAGKNQATYRRLFLLRRITRGFIMSINNKLQNPDQLKNVIINVQQNSELFRLIIGKNDGAEFFAQLIFNDGLNLVQQLLDSLKTKFNQGNNNINLQLYNNLKKSYSELTYLMDKFFEEMERNS